MSKSVRVNIAGTEYGLKGNDEQLLVKAAEELNTQIETIAGKVKGEPSTTITILAGLNIAEKYYENIKQHIADHDYVVSEIESMTGYLKETLTTLI